MMTEMTLERLRAHRNNIHRYQKLLATHLSDLERAYIQRRLTEERTLLEAVLERTLPDRLRAPPQDRHQAQTTSAEINTLLHPADAFVHPMDVVEDCDLTAYEKRAILSSWAKDACAVKDPSELSRSFHAAAVSFDDILDALRILGGAEDRHEDSGQGPTDIPARQVGERSRRSDC
jgi:hypothetical protein